MGRLHTLRGTLGYPLAKKRMSLLPLKRETIIKPAAQEERMAHLAGLCVHDGDAAVS